MPILRKCLTLADIMKYLFITLAFLIALNCKAQYGKITGQIIGIKYSKPFSTAAVLLKKYHKITYADSTGNFTFENLTPSQYLIQVYAKTKPKYVLYFDTSFIVNVQKDSTLHLQIKLPDTCQYETNRKNRRCPICHKKNQVIPIVYGLVIGELDTDNYFYSGCTVTYCDPTWYCKTDKYRF